MNNKKFRQNEELIFEAYCQGNEADGMGKFARKIGISRVTLYRHHRRLSGIIPDYERYLYKVFLRYISVFRFNNIEIKMYYYLMLCFIEKYKKIFVFFLKKGRFKVLYKMLKKIEPMVAAKYHLPRNSKILLKVYNNEIIGVIEEWGEEGFLFKDIDKILRQIIYLTETIRARLMGLLN